jgi:2-haloacid dehalogenase
LIGLNLSMLRQCSASSPDRFASAIEHVLGALGACIVVGFSWRASREGLELADEERQALGDSLPTWPPFDEVPSSLAELRSRGWRIGILSNTDPEFLDASLEAIGVPVDVRITAAEAGSYKPAHGHWLRFFEQTGAERERHAHVAASLFHDIAPANELGLRAVWINRLRETSDLPRVAELGDLSKLPETLDDLVSA